MRRVGLRLNFWPKPPEALSLVIHLLFFGILAGLSEEEFTDKIMTTGSRPIKTESPIRDPFRRQGRSRYSEPVSLKA